MAEEMSRRQPTEPTTLEDSERIQHLEDKLGHIVLSVWKNMEKKIDRCATSNIVVEEWRLVGATLDRLLFGVFLMIIIIITISCFAHDHVHSAP